MRQLRQDLAVEADVQLRQSRDEAAIGQRVEATASVDARDPQ